MKKLNKKGFVLVETLVVSSVVLLIFVLIFRNGMPMMEEYKKLGNYNDIDSLYAANLFKNVIKRDENYYNIFNELKDKDYIDITDCSKLVDVNLCQTVKLRTNITEKDKIYLTHSDPKRIKGKVLKDDRRFNGYINYLANKYNEDLVTSQYIIIVTRTIENKNPFLSSDKLKNEDIKTVKFGSIEIG